MATLPEQIVQLLGNSPGMSALFVDSDGRVQEID